MQKTQNRSQQKHHACVPFSPYRIVINVLILCIISKGGIRFLRYPVLMNVTFAVLRRRENKVFLAVLFNNMIKFGM
jgi:hypothetical protein